MQENKLCAREGVSNTVGILQYVYVTLQLCVCARVCKLHPHNSNMLKVIFMHSELWYRCINQLDTKLPYPRSETHNKGLKQYPL